MALSPEGNYVAFLGAHGGARQLYLRALDSLEAKPIPGTEDAFCTPFFSPDGKWLAFYARGYLKKVSLQGGTPVTLSNISGMLGASWGDDGTIVFAEPNRDGIAKVPAAGGKPENITHVDLRKGEVNHRYPVLLPGGKAMLFAIGLSGRGNEVQIVVQRLDTGERKVLVEGGTYPSYVPTGHLVFIREGTLMAVPFDRERLEVTGASVPVVEAIRQSGLGASQFALSALGSLVYIPGAGFLEGNSLVWVDRQGAVQPLAAPPRTYYYPRLSPDGRQLAAHVRSLKDDVWVYDIPRGAMTRLTFEGDILGPPLWTPDGKRILFLSNQAGFINLFWKPADGSGAEEQITKGEHRYLLGSVSADGRLAFYAENHPTQGPDIWVIPLAGERKPSLFLQTPSNESAPTISPDGRWLAYASNESGRFEIYARAFPGPGGKWQISTEGGSEPVWARNGRELFYRNGDKMMAVDITTEPSFKPGAPRLLFEGKYERSPITHANYDVSPDGQRFLMIKEGGNEPPPTQINVVLNWFEELKRRVPAGTNR